MGRLVAGGPGQEGLIQTPADIRLSPGVCGGFEETAELLTEAELSCSLLFLGETQHSVTSWKTSCPRRAVALSSCGRPCLPVELLPSTSCLSRTPEWPSSAAVLGPCPRPVWRPHPPPPSLGRDPSLVSGWTFSPYLS